jgi:hypothetical protein
VNWVKRTYNQQLARLGIVDLQPNLLETLEPLYDTYKLQVEKLIGEWILRIVAQVSIQ